MLPGFIRLGLEEPQADALLARRGGVKVPPVVRLAVG
jgi:hypothetical protein